MPIIIYLGRQYGTRGAGAGIVIGLITYIPLAMVLNFVPIAFAGGIIALGGFGGIIFFIVRIRS